MCKKLISQGIIQKSVLFSTLVTSGFAVGADNQSDKITAATSSETLTIAAKKQAREPVMVVTAPQPEKEAGTKTTITAEEMQKKGEIGRAHV